MKQRFFSLMSSLCALLVLMPMTVFAECRDALDAHPGCICATACSAGSRNTDCSVCAGAEYCDWCASGEASQESSAILHVQALIDALPNADTITNENRADAESQLTAIDDAKFPLTDEELDALDFGR